MSSSRKKGGSSKASKTAKKSAQQSQSGGKSTVTSLFGLFTSFSGKRSNRSATTVEDISQINDVELLKRLKKRITNIVDKHLDRKRAREIKQLFHSVWMIEYTELKRRMKVIDVHQHTIRQKAATVNSLRALSTSHVDDALGDDTREVAMWLLGNFTDSTPANTLHSNPDNTANANPDLSGIDEETEMRPIDRFRKGVRKAMVINTWKSLLKPDDELSTSATPQEHSTSTSKTSRPATTTAVPTKDIEKEDTRVRPAVASGLGTNIAGVEEIHSIEKTMKSPSAPRTYTPSVERRAAGLISQTAAHTIIADNHATENVHDESESETEHAPHRTFRFKSLTPSDPKSPVPDYPIDNNSRLQKCLNTIGTWDFNIFELHDIIEVRDRCMVLAMWHSVEHFNMLNWIEHAPTKFVHWMQCVEKGYLPNPYHNRLHGTDVLCNVAFMLKTDFFQKHTSQLDKFSMLLAASIHDLGHDGFNNQFHVNTMSPRAVTYNDQSVLENYHISLAFQMLKRPECNWFQRLPRPVQRYIRTNVIEMVLATDMRDHNNSLAQLTELVTVVRQEYRAVSAARGHQRMDSTQSIASVASTASELPFSFTQPSVPLTPDIDERMGTASPIDDEFDEKSPYVSIHEYSTELIQTMADIPLRRSTTAAIHYSDLSTITQTRISDLPLNDNTPRATDVEDERLFAMKNIVHLCDIGGPTKDIKMGKIWALKIMQEFFKQGDKEKQLGLPVSPLCDRHTSSMEQGQIGFIKFVVRPFYDVWVQLVPELNHCVQLLCENLQYWQTQALEKSMTRSRARSAPTWQLNRSIDAKTRANLLMLQNNSVSAKADSSVMTHPSHKPQHFHSKTHHNSHTPTQNDDSSDFPNHSSGKSKKSVHFATDGKNNDLISRNDHSSTAAVMAAANDHDLSSLLDGMDAPSQLPGFEGRFSEMTDDGDEAMTVSDLRSKSLRHRRLGRRGSGESDISDASHGWHSIHISIPTSRKQLEDQPQPVYSVLESLEEHFKERQKLRQTLRDDDKELREISSTVDSNDAMQIQQTRLSRVSSLDGTRRSIVDLHKSTPPPPNDSRPSSMV